MTAVNNFDILTNFLDFEKWKECDFFLILWGILTALTLANFKDQGMSLFTGNLLTVNTLQCGFAYVLAVLNKAVLGSWHMLEYNNSRQFVWGCSGFGC